MSVNNNRSREYVEMIWGENMTDIDYSWIIQRQEQWKKQIFTVWAFCNSDFDTNRKLIEAGEQFSKQAFKRLLFRHHEQIRLFYWNVIDTILCKNSPDIAKELHTYTNWLFNTYKEVYIRAKFPYCDINGKVVGSPARKTNDYLLRPELYHTNQESFPLVSFGDISAASIVTKLLELNDIEAKLVNWSNIDDMNNIDIYIIPDYVCTLYLRQLEDKR